MRGKRSRAPTPSAGHFSPYPGARPRTLPHSAYEMSFACRGPGRSGRDLESVSEVEADKYNSEDSIMGGGGESPSGASIGRGGSVRQPPDGIMRTKVITISYDERRPDSGGDELKSHPGQWRPKDRF